MGGSENGLRLRANLSGEHVGLIETVGSVGYRFRQSRWGDLIIK